MQGTPDQTGQAGRLIVRSGRQPNPPCGRELGSQCWGAQSQSAWLLRVWPSAEDNDKPGHGYQRIQLGPIGGRGLVGRRRSAARRKSWRYRNGLSVLYANGASCKVPLSVCLRHKTGDGGPNERSRPLDPSPRCSCALLWATSLVAVRRQSNRTAAACDPNSFDVNLSSLLANFQEAPLCLFSGKAGQSNPLLL